MKERLDENKIARRAVQEFTDGMVINLGYGMPALCSNLIPENITVFLQGENGSLGYGPPSTDEEKDYEIINSSDQPVTCPPGMSFFDSAMSFDMIRGGHGSFDGKQATDSDNASCHQRWKAPDSQKMHIPAYCPELRQKNIYRLGSI